VSETATATHLHSPVQLDDFFTDGTQLFRVIDLVPGHAALLENAYDGELVWQSINALRIASIKRIVPSARVRAEAF
jgi:hypothetical protein